MFFREQAIIRQILTTGCSPGAGEGVTIHMGEKTGGTSHVCAVCKQGGKQGTVYETTWRRVINRLPNGLPYSTPLAVSIQGKTTEKPKQ